VERLEERNLLSSLGFVPSPQTANGSLTGAAAIAAKDIWAVGGIFTSSGQQTLAEHFNGTSWSVVPTPSPTSNSFFSGVAAAASYDVWAVGNSLIEHWNGSSWSVVPSPTGTRLNGVTAPASNNAWAVGDETNSGNAVVEHWDGTSWSIVSSPAFTGVGLSAVSADSPNDVWAVGTASFAAGAPFTGPAVLHWNGQTWSLLPAANTNAGVTLLAVTALSPTNVWAAGNTYVRVPNSVPPGTHPVPVAMVEQWDGTSWSSLPNSSSENKNLGSVLSGIAAVSPNEVWAVGTDNSATATLVEQWDGTSLKIVNSPNPGNGLNELMGVTALSDGTVAAVGTQSSSTTGQTPLILQNAASAPKGATTAAVTTTMMPFPLNAASVPSTGATTPAPTQPMPAPLDPAPADQFFAAAGMIDQPFPMAGLQTVATSMMMQPANGMSQLADAGLMEARIDAFFQMLDARLISLESTLVARMPQLDGMIQSFNALVTMAESAIAGHPIDDLSGKV
jgi:hypothetical protein